MVDFAQSLTSVVIGALVSLVVGYVTARWYGSRWAVKEQRRREHSQTLIKVLASWRNDPHRFCRLGVAFRGVSWGDFSAGLDEGGGIVMGRDIDTLLREPIDPPLEYFKELNSHLKTGYPTSLNLWEAIKKETSQYNRDVLGLINQIEKSVVPVLEETGLPPWNGANGRPIEYVLPEDIIFLIWREIERRADGGTPETPEAKQSEPPIFEFQVRWHGGHPALAASERREICDSICSVIAKVCESRELVHTAGNLLAQKASLESQIQVFRKELQEIKSRVDLGNNLKGKCTYCP